MHNVLEINILGVAVVDMVTVVVLVSDAIVVDITGIIVDVSIR